MFFNLSDLSSRVHLMSLHCVILQSCCAQGLVGNDGMNPMKVGVSCKYAPIKYRWWQLIMDIVQILLLALGRDGRDDTMSSIFSHV